MAGSGPPLADCHHFAVRGLLVAGLAGRREHVRVRSALSDPAIDLGLHGERSSQDNDDSGPRLDEPESPEIFLVGHLQFPFR